MVKFIRKVRAKINRTFVADCPLCHKHFYGFQEYKEHMQLEGKNYRIVCHKCVEEHKTKASVK